MRMFANCLVLLIIFGYTNGSNDADEYCERSDQYYGSFDHFLPSGYNPDSVVYGPLTAPRPRILLTAEFDFSLSLLNKLSADKSCIVSPFSISLALSLVHSGTKGTARKEIEAALLKGAANEDFSQHFSNIIESISKVTKGVDFQLANRVYVKEGFVLLDSYLSSIRNNYKADAVSLDFDDSVGSAKAVNSFVNEVTHGKIEEMVDENTFDPSLLLILINAVYMNAKWDHTFEQRLTEPGTFYVNKSVEKTVDYMYHSMVRRNYYENDQYQLLSMKYMDSRYRFNIFLPKEKFGLSKLQTELTGENIAEIISSKMTNELVNIKLPKFKIESKVDLVSILKTLGIKNIFAPTENLSGIAETYDLYIGKAIHKATIQVDEEGTVAAAVTLYALSGCCLNPPKPIEFIADHPFMFCVTFDNHPLFIGTFY